MAPPSQKGTGKKGRDIRQSRSRNTTPSLVGNTSADTELGETAFLELQLAAFRTSDEIVEQYGAAIPSSKDLESLLERLKRLVDTVETRSAISDKGMRMASNLRKDRLEEIESERRDEEHRERIKKEAADEEERSRNKLKMKKRKEVSSAREERPLTHGAHGLAPQDGSNLDYSSPVRDPTMRKSVSRLSDNDSASSSLSPTATPAATGMDFDEKDVNDDESSADEHQPKPAPAVPHLQTFGEDPSTFPDPTIYEIRQVTPDMDDDMKREIYSVAVFPSRNLEDLIPGSPPDKDFSNAKPTNQVQANTFATYLEPYFRPFTEEDLAFLRERGDRTTPFIIPRRGKKHYTEIWAEEDGVSVDSHQGRDKYPPNQARGSIDLMDDAVAETDQISAGPILSRLLSTLRPERRATPSEDKATTNGFTNGESVNGDTNGDLGEPSQSSDAPAPIPPATYMPDSNTEAWKKATHPKLDHAQVDERIKQELRHIGFLPLDTEPDYDAHYDDEIAVRLRVLQAKLKEQSIINGARKARLMDLVKERMAHQEYTTILEDLDSQVQAAYHKRTRTMGKNKKAKKPGGAGGGSHFVNGSNTGVARPGINELTKTVMERRKKWVEEIGPVFDTSFKVPRVNNPENENTSIFKPEDMAEFVRKEKEAWDEEGEEE